MPEERGALSTLPARKRAGADKMGSRQKACCNREVVLQGTQGMCFRVARSTPSQPKPGQLASLSETCPPPLPLRTDTRARWGQSSAPPCPLEAPPEGCFQGRISNPGLPEFRTAFHAKDLPRWPDSTFLRQLGPSAPTLGSQSLQQIRPASWGVRTISCCCTLRNPKAPLSFTFSPCPPHGTPPGLCPFCHHIRVELPFFGV